MLALGAPITTVDFAEKSLEPGQTRDGKITNNVRSMLKWLEGKGMVRCARDGR